VTSGRFVSHGLTHVGLVRRRNEDAFLDRPELGRGLGLWAVADGMGGHEAGDYASARIVAALGALDPTGDLGAFIEVAAGQLREVDAELRARASLLGPAAVIASTVVVLLAQAEEFAVLWAGDSRAYRWRNGECRQLTVITATCRSWWMRGCRRRKRPLCTRNRIS
jgi:serine/threonine protein phosphatase PrpC